MEGNAPGYIPLFVWDTKMNNLDEKQGWTFSTGVWACCWGWQALGLR